MSPAISVIIPVYNCEKYLTQCIESVLNQTFQDFELILVDDGSHDSSPDICDNFRQKDERIQVIHKPNGGVSSARNEGIKVARGEYITFVDSDDYIEEEMLEYLYGQAQEHLADIVVSGLLMEYWDNGTIKETKVYRIQNSKKYSAKELLEEWGQTFPMICMCGPCCKLYNSEIIRNNTILFDINLSCGEDTHFNLDILAKVKSIYFCKEVFYHYRRWNSDSLYSRFHHDIYEIQCSTNEKQLRLMATLNCEKRAIYQCEGRYVTTLIGEIHGHFKFYNSNTEQDRLNLVEKISRNQRVIKCKVGMIRGLKNKLLLILLKRKKYKTILKIFERYYIK